MRPGHLPRRFPVEVEKRGPPLEPPCTAQVVCSMTGQPSTWTTADRMPEVTEGPHAWPKTPKPTTLTASPAKERNSGATWAAGPCPAFTDCAQTPLHLHRPCQNSTGTEIPSHASHSSLSFRAPSWEFSNVFGKKVYLLWSK